MISKQQTFDAYRQGKTSYIQELIRRSLKVLSNSRYSNVTNLSKDVAQLVNELKLRDELEMQASGDKVPDYILSKVSYTTLLRNNNYRKLLDLQISEQGKAPAAIQSDEQSTVMLLKARIANLESQNEILKNKIIGFDDAKRPLNNACNDPQVELLKALEADRIFLVDFIQSIMNSTKDMFRVHETSGELLDFKERTVLTKDDLKKWERISKRVGD